MRSESRTWRTTPGGLEACATRLVPVAAEVPEAVDLGVGEADEAREDAEAIANCFHLAEESDGVSVCFRLTEESDGLREVRRLGLSCMVVARRNEAALVQIQ